MQFKVGDRIRYAKKDNTLTGKLGRVTSVDDTSYPIKWTQEDTGSQWCSTEIELELELVPPMSTQPISREVKNKFVLVRLENNEGSSTNYIGTYDNLDSIKSAAENSARKENKRFAIFTCTHIVGPVAPPVEWAEIKCDPPKDAPIELPPQPKC